MSCKFAEKIMMTKKHIVVIGLGGVGGYFGFKICQSNQETNLHQVSFVARGTTYEIVKSKGLTLLSPEHENNITKPNFVLSSIGDIRNPDLVLICVKEYDLENACRQLKEVISQSTILLPMMNGADIYDRIRKIIPQNTILPSCVYVASHIKQKGTVEHKGKPGKLIFGRDSQNSTTDIDWVVDLLSNCAIDFDLKDDALVDIWSKFIFIASFGMITAKYDSSIGSVCSNLTQKEEATKIMQEIKAVADKKGIDLGEDIISKTFVKASTFPPSTPTSLQLDVHSGKENDELELFAGAIMRYAQDLDISTPHTKGVYETIKSKRNRSTL